jgi:hypothetical protein
MNYINYTNLVNELEIRFGLEIFALCGVENLQKNGQLIRLFDETKHTSETFYLTDNKSKPYIQDFKNDKRYYPITAYMKKHNVKWKTAVKTLGEQFGLIPISNENKKIIPQSSLKFSKSVKEQWSDYDLAFWQKYQIKPEILAQFKVLAFSEFKITLGSGQLIPCQSSSENPIFAYQVSQDCYKVYKPLEKNKKYKFHWLGDKPTDFDDFWGIDLLPDFCDFILICEGVKDCMSIWANKGLFELDVFAVGKDNAKGEMDKETISFLQSKCNQLILLLDNDKAGQEASKKHSQLHNLPYIQLPDLPNGKKDISDLIELYHQPQSDFKDFDFDKLLVDYCFREFVSIKESPSLPLVNEPTQVSKFPIEALPKPFADIIMEVSQKKSIPLAFLGLSVITVCASAIGNERYIKLAGDDIPCILWSVMVGSSSSGKSRAMQFAKKPITNQQTKLDAKYEKELKDWQEAARKAEEASERFDDPKPIQESSFVIDFTFEGLVKVLADNPRGFACIKDELASWYKSMNQYRRGSDAQNWLSLWNGYEIKRNLASGQNVFVAKPFATVIGGTQFNKIKEFAEDGRDEDGFLFRLLFAFAPTKEKPNEWSREMVRTKTIEDYENLVAKIYNIPYSERNYLEFSSEAMNRWIDWFNNNEEKKFHSKDDKIDSLYGKLADYVPRFALILEVMAWTCELSEMKEISLTSIEGAIQLIEYFRVNAQIIQNLLKDDNQKYFSESREAFFNALPSQFTTAQAVKLGKEYGFKEDNLRTRVLPAFVLKKFIKRVDKGVYEKLFD